MLNRLVWFASPAALVATLYAGAASAHEEPSSSPVRHIVAAHFQTTPPYLQLSPELRQPWSLGGGAEYLYRLGVVRLGVGLRYMHTWQKAYGTSEFESFGHELAIPVLVSFAHTFAGGAELGVMLGAGYDAYFKHYDGYGLATGHGVHTEVLGSFDHPIAEGLDLSVRAGVSFAFFDAKRPAGVLSEVDFLFMRVSVPIAVGLRKRW